MTALLQAGLMQANTMLASGGLQTLLVISAFAGPLLYRLIKSVKEGFDEQKAMYETVATAILLAVMNYIQAPTTGFIAFVVNLIPTMAFGYLAAVAFLWFTKGEIAKIVAPLAR